MERSRSNALVRLVGLVAATTLVGGLAGSITLVLGEEQATTQNVEFAAGRGAGSLVLQRRDSPGAMPFLPSIQTRLDLDSATLPLPPLTSAAVSLSRVGSEADLGAALLATLLAGSDEDGLAIGAVGVAAAALAPGFSVAGLDDSDRDRIDDDGRFSLLADDGSAACVRVAPGAAVSVALGLKRAAGVTWSPYGRCGFDHNPTAGSEVRVGTTAGTYGGMATEVCSLGRLVDLLEADYVTARAWAAAQALDVAAIPAFIATLTPVVLMRDTLVTDNGLDGGRIHPRQAVLQRGTTVMVDARGTPRVRCISGSPLTRPGALLDSVTVAGESWDGFALDEVVDIPPAEAPTDLFVLVDLATGHPIERPPGSAAASGPVATGRSSS